MTTAIAMPDDITVQVGGESLTLSRDEAETLLAELTDALGAETDSPSGSFAKLFAK